MDNVNQPTVGMPAKSEWGWKKIVAFVLAGVTVLVLGLLGLLMWMVTPFIGPADPEGQSRAYLAKRHCSAEVIEQVIALEPLAPALFDRLAAEDSESVKFLIAQNPFLSATWLARLAQDPSDFVRGGAAQSPNLTPAQIQALMADASHTTQAYLARNPYVPEADLIRLHEQYSIELVWFAMNPRCPQVLRQKMIDTQDEEALYWLDNQDSEDEDAEDGEESDEDSEDGAPSEAPGTQPAASTPIRT